MTRAARQQRERTRTTARASRRASAIGAKTPRGEATRALLVRSAQQIFERDGFLGTRITDITSAAGAATGSFYRYFNDKEDVFLAVVDELAHEGLLAPSLDFLGDAEDVVFAEILDHHRSYLETYFRNARMMRVIEEVTNINERLLHARTARAQSYIARNVEVVTKLQAEGRADPALDPLIAGRTLSVMVSRAAYVTFVLEEEGQDSIGPLAETLTRLWVNALGVAASDANAMPARSRVGPHASTRG